MHLLKVGSKNDAWKALFLLEFEQIFVCSIYFNSTYVGPIRTMSFNNFSRYVNLDIFNIL